MKFLFTRQHTSLCKFGILFAFMLILLFSIEAHGLEDHSSQICRVIFGYTYTDENSFKNETNKETNRAFQLIRYAVAVSIDNKGKKTEDYTKLKGLLLGTSVKMPIVSEDENELLITNKYHRQVCHQGFDYVYANSSSNKRWNNVGRKLLINVTREAFTYNSRVPDDATATFIAMIAYYTHILGDLEEGETKWMKNSVGTFYKFVDELALKIDAYGKKLSDSSCVNDLIDGLKKLQPKMPTVRADQVTPERKRYVYSEQIFSVLTEYVPQIIQRNVNQIFKINTDSSALKNAA